MSYVIVGSCVNDAVCTDVCPVNCIQPTPEQQDFSTAEILYINPALCIDCHACADACPINAIYPAEQLPPRWAEYKAINAAYFDQDTRP